MRTTVTETDNSKVTRNDFYYEIVPNEHKPGEYNVRLHYQKYGWHSYKQGWLFKTAVTKHFHDKDQVEKFYNKSWGGQELSFPSVSEARKYITHINQKSEKVYAD